MSEPTTACRTGRHRLCGGYQCACSCHPGTPEERAGKHLEAITRFLEEMEEVWGSAGRHQGHRLSKAGRCVYCSCGLRYQGSLPSAKERAEARIAVSERQPSPGETP